MTARDDYDLTGNAPTAKVWYAALNEIDNLRGVLNQKEILVANLKATIARTEAALVGRDSEIERLHGALGQLTDANRRLLNARNDVARRLHKTIDQQVEANRRLREEVEKIVTRKIEGRIAAAALSAGLKRGREEVVDRLGEPL